ncbi:MAG: histidine kinase [Alphaproteobacteria bacterium]|nr:histidine kinase [Alphaproteobacteria bacterium]
MDLDELYRLLRGSHVRATGIVDTIRDPLLVLGSDLCVLSANPAFYRTFETDPDETVGLSFTALGNGQWDIDELRLLLENVIPRSVSVFDYEVRAKFPNVGQRTMLVSAQRLVHPDSRQRILLLSIVDATTRRKKEDEKDLLIGEFDHRIKNLLSVVQALARQTRTTGRTAEEYRGDLLNRLEALGHSLEVSAQKDEGGLADLVRRVLEPYRDGASRITLTGGPEVALRPAEAMSLGMILHELATNALKYGALSQHDGDVEIAWTLDQDKEETPLVRLHWRETNGPEVTPPTAKGFGTRLITFSTEQELGGTAELDYPPEGFTAHLTFPRL